MVYSADEQMLIDNGYNAFLVQDLREMYGENDEIKHFLNKNLDFYMNL